MKFLEVGCLDHTLFFVVWTSGVTGLVNSVGGIWINTEISAQVSLVFAPGEQLYLQFSDISADGID